MESTINQTHVVVFKEPLLSVSDFNVFNLKFVSESIPNGTVLMNTPQMMKIP